MTETQFVDLTHVDDTLTLDDIAECPFGCGLAIHKSQQPHQSMADCSADWTELFASGEWRREPASAAEGSR